MPSQFQVIDPKSLRFPEKSIDPNMRELDRDYLRMVGGEVDEGLLLLGTNQVTEEEIKKIKVERGIFEWIPVQAALDEVQKDLEHTLDYYSKNNYVEESITRARQELVFFKAIRGQVRSAVRVWLSGKSTDEFFDRIQKYCPLISDHLKLLFNLTLPIAVVPEGPDGPYVENSLLFHSELERIKKPVETIKSIVAKLDPEALSSRKTSQKIADRNPETKDELQGFQRELLCDIESFIEQHTLDGKLYRGRIPGCENRKSEENIPDSRRNIAGYLFELKVKPDPRVNAVVWAERHERWAQLNGIQKRIAAANLSLPEYLNKLHGIDLIATDTVFIANMDALECGESSLRLKRILSALQTGGIDELIKFERMQIYARAFGLTDLQISDEKWLTEIASSRGFELGHLAALLSELIPERVEVVIAVIQAVARSGDLSKLEDMEKYNEPLLSRQPKLTEAFAAAILQAVKAAAERGNVDALRNILSSDNKFFAKRPEAIALAKEVFLQALSKAGNKGDLYNLDVLIQYAPELIEKEPAKTAFANALREALGVKAKSGELFMYTSEDIVKRYKKYPGAYEAVEPAFVESIKTAGEAGNLPYLSQISVQGSPKWLKKFPLAKATFDEVLPRAMQVCTKNSENIKHRSYQSDLNYFLYGFPVFKDAIEASALKLMSLLGDKGLVMDFQNFWDHHQQLWALPKLRECYEQNLCRAIQVAATDGRIGQLNYIYGEWLKEFKLAYKTFNTEFPRGVQSAAERGWVSDILKLNDPVTSPALKVAIAVASKNGNLEEMESLLQKSETLSLEYEEAFVATIKAAAEKGYCYNLLAVAENFSANRRTHQKIWDAIGPGICRSFEVMSEGKWQIEGHFPIPKF